MDKLCEVCVEFFRDNAFSFVADRPGRSSCDGSSLRTRKYVSGRVPGGPKVKRKGGPLRSLWSSKGS